MHNSVADDRHHYPSDVLLRMVPYLFRQGLRQLDQARLDALSTSRTEAATKRAASLLTWPAS